MPRPTPSPRDARRLLLLLGSSRSAAAVPYSLPVPLPVHCVRATTLRPSPALSRPPGGRAYAAAFPAKPGCITPRLLCPCGPCVPSEDRVPLHWLGYGYAALVASGGIFGYVKTGRVPSLVVGLFFGSLAGLGSYQLSQDPKNVWLFLAATSGTFAGVMALRSYYYGKVMPVGLIAGASLLMVAKVGVRMLMAYNE
ncbi:transmembrane protein 14B isoform X2 [Callithrix jacchus]|uniref:transmembrane protein 14B isoform X1 n=1 Tax=Callithrix jacchus TaxID=9483 RepID=UPI0023DD1438|nr:transmembrane protein 14B isoform X1 [Callithrix jacchus]